MGNFHFPAGGTPPAVNSSSYQLYPAVFQYFIASTTHRPTGSGLGIGVNNHLPLIFHSDPSTQFSNGKSFGVSNEVFGVDIYDVYNIGGQRYVYVSLLDANYSLDIPVAE